MSSHPDAPPRGTTRDIPHFLAHHRDLARELPAPDRVLLRREFPPEVREYGIFTRAINAGVITVVGSVYDAEYGKHYKQYRVTDAAHEWAQENATETGPWAECDHFGIRNLGDGDYTCGHSTCDRTYARGDHEDFGNEETPELVTDGGVVQGRERDSETELVEHVTVVEFNENAVDHGYEAGERVILSGVRRESHVRDDEQQDFVKIGEAVAIIELYQPIPEDEVTDWCNSPAGKLALDHWFDHTDPGEVVFT